MERLVLKDGLLFQKFKVKITERAVYSSQQFTERDLGLTAWWNTKWAPRRRKDSQSS